MTAEFWEGRYKERDRIWSGRPNDALVTTVAGLPPGRALDLGCGEGGDSVWLAERGWQVTAVDVSATAVARARETAAGLELPAGQITWLVEDLGRWEPTDRYDLVCACFLHSPIEFARSDVLRRAASAVATGGHMLIVGHASPPPWANGHDHGDHHFLPPSEEIANLRLDGDLWDVVVSEIRTRSAIGPDGAPVDFEDAVVLARRH